MVSAIVAGQAKHPMKAAKAKRRAAGKSQPKAKAKIVRTAAIKSRVQAKRELAKPMRQRPRRSSCADTDRIPTVQEMLMAVVGAGAVGVEPYPQ